MSPLIHDLTKVPMPPVVTDPYGMVMAIAFVHTHDQTGAMDG
jgi:hypothetical protein